MSLIHWWPLNGDLKDYGINNISLRTGTDVSVNNSGKIGKCYYLSGTNSYLAADFSVNELMSGECSFALWLKIPSVAYTQRVNAFTYDSDHILLNTRILGTNGSYSNTGLCLVLQTNNIYSSGSFTAQYLYMGWRDNGSASVWSEVGISLDTWYHVTITKNANRQMIMYFNGTKVAGPFTATSGTFANSIFVMNNSAVWGSGNYRNSPAPVYFNDVRIYDHALSAKEVKEISKGLVLHYNFEDPYVESTTNRANVSSPFSTCYNGSTGKYGWGSNTDMYKEYGTFQGKLCTKVRMGTAGLTAWPFPFFDNVNPYSTTSNTYNTLSFDYYTTHITSLLPYSYRDGVQINSYLNGVSMNGATITGIPLNQWCHITIIFKRTNDSYDGDGVGYVRIGTGAHTSTTTDYWLFANVQSEYKDHETPFVNGTRAAGTVFDCSGYGYNGYQQGEGIQIISDSACGKYSARFDSNESGTSWISTNGIEPLHNFTNLTYTAWIYQRERTNDRACICIGYAYFTIDNNGYLSGYAYGKNPEGYHGGGPVIPLNTWTHIAIVWDDSYIYGYVNGVQAFKTSTTGTISYLGINIGKESGLYRQLKGSIADFKIYATALSADDILAEYNRKASIDKSGILFTGEFEEGNSTNINVTKTAMIKCNNIVEGTDNVKLVGGYTQLEYIESTGTQYIDTGIVINNNYEFILEEMNNFDTNNHYMCGSSGNAKMLGTLNNVLWSNGILYSNVTFNRNTKEKIGFKVVTDGSTGSDYLMRNYTTNTKHSGRSSFIPTGSGTVKVFSHNGSTKEIFKCYDFKLFKDDMLVSHLIPAKRNSDSVLGMYDLINKVFRTNAGIGTFTAGPEIGKINAVYANEIKEI